jgi:hypothetical protein
MDTPIRVEVSRLDIHVFFTHDDDERAVAAMTVHVDSCLAHGVAYSDSAVFVCNIENSFASLQADFEGRADSTELLLAAGVDHAEVVMRAD